MTKDATPPTPEDPAPVGTSEDIELETYDLNEDGKVSPVEGYRATLGLVDARLERIADEADHKGIKGHLADAAHRVVDKLDND